MGVITYLLSSPVLGLPKSLACLLTNSDPDNLPQGNFNIIYADIIKNI